MSIGNGSQSLPLSEPPRQVLAHIISQYGPEVCSNPSRVEALLRDMCGEYRREINLLVSALKDKVAADLLSAPAAPISLLVSRLTTRLRDNHSLTDEAARWAVESWALALGRITREQLSAPAPVLPALQPVAPLLPPPAQLPVPPAGNSSPQTQSYPVPPPQYAGQGQMQPPLLSWPPPVQGGYAMMPNTSGTQGPVPPEVMAMRWSWGGFFWNWLWMCNNGLAGTKILLLLSCFVPYVNVISVIYLGISGNQLAWQNRHFDSVDHFKRVQGIWSRWALWFLLGTLGFYILAALIAAMAGNH